MSERLPMFPLGTVMFPFTAVSLRVFEDRYQHLVDRMLEEDGTFGIVLIERGFEVGGGDQRFDVGTRVRVAAVQELDGGHRAVVVAGTERIRVEAWLPDDPHPWAEVTAWPDEEDEPGAELIDDARQRLGRVMALASELGADVSELDLEVSEDPLAASYQLSALCPVTALDGYRLLTAPGATSRLRLAVELLDDQIELIRAQLRSE